MIITPGLRQTARPNLPLFAAPQQPQPPPPKPTAVVPLVVTYLHEEPAPPFEKRKALHPRYRGTITNFSFGNPSTVDLSRLRCALTSSGGVCDSHSESDRSW